MRRWLVGLALVAASAGGAMAQPAPRSATTEWLRTARPSTHGHVDVVRHIAMLEGLFLDSWMKEWLRSTRDTPLDSGFAVAAAQRMARKNYTDPLMHCHGVAPEGPPQRRPARGQNPERGVQGPDQLIIPSDRLRHAICPSWTLWPRRERGDERLDMDAALGEASRQRVREQRAALIDQLSRAVDSFPADEFLAGQHIRFLVDQRDTARATAAASACKASGWWCAMLEGYVAHWRGARAAADSIFRVGLSRAPIELRCSLADVALLYRGDARQAYMKQPCIDRWDMNDRIWWLADPLYTEPGNDRRSEHNFRLVLVMLHINIVEDGRYDWAEVFGGSAVQEMMIRYGWPSSAQWGSDELDRSHQSYLGAPRPARFTTNEYSPDRVHLMASWPAVVDPFAATPRDWVLTAAAAKAAQPDITLWWPGEHYARDDRPIAAITGDHQLALFRRDTGALMAFTIGFDTADVADFRAKSLAGSVILSPRPDSFSFTPLSARAGEPIRLRRIVAADPQIVGVELFDGPGSGPGRRAVRTRFGISPAVPLKRLPADSIAVSDLAILSDGIESLPRPLTEDALLSRMLAGTTIPAGSTIGLYWETYGLRPVDTVSVSLKVEALARPGLFRRIAMDLGLAQRAANDVSLTWSETVANGSSNYVDATGLAMGRSMLLNVSRLPRGSYDLTLTVTGRGRGPARTVRQITIE